MSTFDDASKLLIVVKITTKKLYLMAYSSYQKWLFERVFDMRERLKLTFNAIAKQLTSDQVLSPRNCPLMAEHVFSIYKKGKLRHERLTAEPTYEVLTVQCMY